MEQAPNYMKSYWEGIESDALRLLQTARKELSKIALRESGQTSLTDLLSITGEDDHIIDSYLSEESND